MDVIGHDGVGMHPQQLSVMQLVQLREDALGDAGISQPEGPERAWSNWWSK
jgi:hypothetical protein